MTLNISDPLALLPYQNGLADPVLVDGAATAAEDLTTPQRAYKIGEVVPIVFCRRVSGNGGVMVSPGATEARYQNDSTTNALTVSLHLVLSEGDLPTIKIKDTFVGPCRQGTWNQNYEKRSGTWLPGNFVTDVSGKQPWSCPSYCGTSGKYEDMTTLSYVNTFPDGSVRWEHQVHVFVREGIKITRILDSTLGPSNNVIDLALYLMNESAQIPSSMIDNTKMLAAANFCETNGLHFNGVFNQSLNLDEWLEQTSSNFLLRFVESKGKFGFRPVLRVNTDHTIKTTALDWVFTFTEEHLLPDGFDIEYIALEDRKPVCLQMIWRQQPDDDIGFPRTTEMRYTGEAASGPFVQYDLSHFCTNETHAVKVGAYRLARRKYITHTLRLKVKPSSFNSTLSLGDVVRVMLRRETATTAFNYHNFLYEVDRIEKAASGVCVLDLTHLPVDNQGRSLVALDVAAATAVGATISAGKGSFDCDDNSATDNTDLGNDGLDYGAGGGGIDPPSLDDTSIDLSQPDSTDWTEGGTSPIGPSVTVPDGSIQPIGSLDNPVDPLEQPVDKEGIGDITGGTGTNNAPLVTDTLNVPSSSLPCDGVVVWSKVNKNTGEETVLKTLTQPINGNYSLSITTNEIDHYIKAVGKCKDPSTASGYNQPQVLGQTPDAVELPALIGEYVWHIQDTGTPPQIHTINSCIMPELDPVPKSFTPTNGQRSSAYMYVTKVFCNGNISTSLRIIRGPENVIPSFNQVLAVDINTYCAGVTDPPCPDPQLFGIEDYPELFGGDDYNIPQADCT